MRQSAFCRSNAIAVEGTGGVLLVDPGVDGSDLEDLVDDLEGLGLRVAVGFSTHPHWDHLLWHARFGEVPRYATARGATAAWESVERARGLAAAQAPGVPPGLLGLVAPLPEGAVEVPWEGPPARLVEHEAHAPGHAALVFPTRGVLLAADMLSDVEIPLLDPGLPDQIASYLTALDRLSAALTSEVSTLVPGHGAVAHGKEIAERLRADRAYVEALRRARTRRTRVSPPTPGTAATGSPRPTSRTCGWPAPGLLRAADRRGVRRGRARGRAGRRHPPASAPACGRPGRRPRSRVR